MSFQLGSVNRQFNTESETFVQSFNLTHDGDPLFHKKFDGSDNSKVLLGDDSFVIKNHFFVTGEQVKYQADTDLSGRPVGIQHGLNGVGAATTLPQDVFVIKVSENNFKVAATKALAKAGSPIGLTTVGAGVTHTFTSIDKNSKCVISIDDIIQSPVYKRNGATTTLVSIANREANVTDASFMKQYDLLQINDEIVRIAALHFNGVQNKLLLDRNWMGTTKQGHSANDTVQLVFGDYNIVDDKITFADVPFGGTRQTVGIDSSDFVGNTFGALTEVFQTGTKVKIRSLNPPSPLVANDDYFIITNAANNFSFAATKGEALVGIAITLSNAGIGTHKLIVADIVEGSSFHGRQFIRSDYAGNVILDDISQNFTGIGKTFTLTEEGNNTTGITSDFGAILINNIFQKPEVDYNFLSSPSPGITSVRFTGNEAPGVTEILSDDDVNANRLPRKGILVSVSNSEGLGYLPGQYDDIRLESASTGIGASIAVEIGVGNSISRFRLQNPGFGYTTGENLNVVGIPTISSYGSDFSAAQFTVVDTADDEFTGFVFGKLQVLDDISDQFDSRKKIFTLKENNITISIEKVEGSILSLQDILMIFVNDTLQKPGVAYKFEGGTQIEFLEPPVEGSVCQILFYRGTDKDISTTTSLQTIKTGDGLAIKRQDERIVRGILARDSLQTTNYKGVNISATKIPRRPVVWSKQQDDLFIEGVKVSKSRDIYEPRIFPATRLIKSVDAGDSTAYVMGGALSFKKTETNTGYSPTTDFPIKIVDDNFETGFGSTTFEMKYDKQTSANIFGDEGNIIGVGVAASRLSMHLYLPTDNSLRNTRFGGLTKTGISTGDYMVVSRSNVGAGLTSKNTADNAIVGIATEFIDGVYQIADIEDVTAQIVRVHVNIETGHGLNFTGLSSAIGNYYGSYSWGKVVTGSIGTSFAVNTLDGVTGLSTAPQLIRDEKLLVDYP